MTNKIILAGFGGQGVIFAGKLLSYAAMKDGLDVSAFPSYGAEMRGGTCNTSVIISDAGIPSPIVAHPDTALILNTPSKIKFEDKVKKDGVMLMNSSLINEKPKRSDIKNYSIDASGIADRLGNIRSANMVMIGALAKVTGLVKLETLIASLAETISARNKALIEINTKALKAGYESV
jgi:2-oxoglutarate ferredoxin oxidoreductase subunit gamma